MKIKNTILVFSLVLCILFGISCVAAEDIGDADNAIGDENPVGGQSDEIAAADAFNEGQTVGKSNNDLLADGDDGTFTALQSKINNASSGDTITLDKDYAYNDDFGGVNGISINKNLTIDGKGHTIDAKSKSRIFNINPHLLSNCKVTLKNIVFKNGFAKIYGGAIFNFGDLTVINCNFINNYAYTAGGAINSLGSLNLKNSRFYKNYANGDAGAVFSLNLERGVVFYKNFLMNVSNSEVDLIFAIGMNMTLKHGKDYISNCIFTNNVAKGRGGGAVYAYSNIDINSCTFNSNRASEKGAAVFACKNLHIKGSKFNNNRVGMYGGAVYFKCHEISGSYVNGKWVSSVKFYSGLIEGSTFANNVAGERGGAIYGFKASASDKIHCARAVKCVFADNKAPKGKEIYGGTLKNCIYKNTKIIIKSAIVKKSAKRLVLTATLKKGAVPLKGKLVIFKFNGLTFKAKTNSKGIANAVVKSGILKKLKVGKTVAYQASYGSLISKRTAKVVR